MVYIFTISCISISETLKVSLLVMWLFVGAGLLVTYYFWALFCLIGIRLLPDKIVISAADVESRNGRH